MGFSWESQYNYTNTRGEAEVGRQAGAMLVTWERDLRREEVLMNVIYASSCS